MIGLQEFEFELLILHLVATEVAALGQGVGWGQEGRGREEKDENGKAQSHGDSHKPYGAGKPDSHLNVDNSRLASATDMPLDPFC